MTNITLDQACVLARSAKAELQRMYKKWPTLPVDKNDVLWASLLSSDAMLIRQYKRGILTAEEFAERVILRMELFPFPFQQDDRE